MRRFVARRGGYTDSPAVVTVGEAQNWLPELIERAKGLKVGNGFDPSTEMCVALAPFLIAADMPRRAVDR